MTDELVQDGKLVVIGVVQEQHAERAELYAQWRQLEWPILHDLINKLGLEAVPVPVAIDEYGIVRTDSQAEAGDAAKSKIGSIRLKDKQSFQRDFVDKQFEQPPAVAPQIDKSKLNTDWIPLVASTAKTIEGWIEIGDAYMLWGTDEQIDNAIQAYQAAKDLGASPTDVDFRLGVAFRQRYDSGTSLPDDFQSAVAFWTSALEAKPSQYIWRRRIQQYGPRLDKPYPFYDWVSTAEKEVADRGDTPVELPVRLTESEIAQPAKQSDEVYTSTPAENPDPENLLTADKEQLVEIQTAVVPARAKPGETVRIHVDLRVNADAKWNNEAESLEIWIDSSDEAKCSTQLFGTDQPKEPESDEPRQIEFEATIPENVTAPTAKITGFAAYTVCRSSTGECNKFRQEIAIEIPLTTAK